MNSIIARDPVIKLNSVLYRLIGVIVAFLACGSSLLSKFVPGSLRLLVVFAVVILLISVMFRLHIPTNNARYLFLMLMMILLMLIRGSWPFSEAMMFSTGIVLCAFSFRRGAWIETALDFMEFFYLIYAVATIFMFFNADIYKAYANFAFPVYSASLIRTYSLGCMPGLAHHYSTNAMLISVGIILACSRFFSTLQIGLNKKKKKAERYFQLLLIGVFAIALLMTGKRGHIVFVAAAILVIYYSSDINKGSKKRITKIFLFVSCLIIIMTIVFMMVPSLSVFLQRFETSVERGDLGNGRSFLWNLAFSAFKNNPVFGIGWNQYSSTLSESLHMRREMNHVHNVYLQLLCETGVFGFVIFMLWFIIIFVLTIRNYKKINYYYPPEYIQANYQLKFSLGFQVFFLMYSLTGNPLYDEEMYIPYFICCAITLYYSRRMKDYLIEKRIEEESNREKILFDDSDIEMPDWIK